jgi:hypothetical protein
MLSSETIVAVTKRKAGKEESDERERMNMIHPLPHALRSFLFLFLFFFFFFCLE